MKLESLPPTFREIEIDQILAALRAGDSCSLVGTGSVGKSNLLRYLQREDVRQARLGPEWGSYLFVYVDVNKMLKRSLWGLWELLLHQLVVELTNQDAGADALRFIDDLHAKAAEPETRYLALRYLDRAVAAVCNRLGLRLVILMDEFDDLCGSMSPRGFAALRSLRDDHKYQLMYVVATRVELSRLREDVAEIEAFEELVSPNAVWLGPYRENDALFMLRRLEGRYDISLGQQRIDDLLAATGGHPGLLSAGFHGAAKLQEDLLEALVGDWRVQDECQRIWHSLAAEEQLALTGLANDPVSSPQQDDLLNKLGRKGLLGGPWAEKDRIFSPLFAEFIRREQPVVGDRLHVDHQRRILWIGDRKTSRLTPLEYKLIAFLEKHRGQVCTRDDLIQHIYPDEVVAEGVTDSRIDSLVKRLRKRVEPDPNEPRYILTVWGHGYQLAEAERYEE